MKIQTAIKDDIPQLTELLAVLFSQETEFSVDPKNQEKGLTLIIDNPNMGHILVAKKEQEVVGMVNILFTFSTALGEKVALLEDMIVAPDWRHNGIGSQLIQQAKITARNLGCSRITLLTDRDNHMAQAFYRNQGFRASDMVPFRLPLV